LVNTPNSTAVRSTLEDQKAKAVCKIAPGSTCGLVSFIGIASIERCVSGVDRSNRKGEARRDSDDR